LNEEVMTDLRRRSSYSSCSLPPLHSWICSSAPAGSTGLRAYSTAATTRKRGRAAGRGRSSREPREGSWKGEEQLEGRGRAAAGLGEVRD